MTDDDFDARMAAARESAIRERRAQGLPDYIEDTATLAWLAEMWDATKAPADDDGGPVS